MRTIVLLLLAVLVPVAGCGGRTESEDSRSKEESSTQETRSTPGTRSSEATEPASGRKSATITVGESEFGRMLFDSTKQAIYIFERDAPRSSVCYGECADAWPPVYTEGPPIAAGGANQSLLGTIRRRDGRLQVTYDGNPLYFYAHEAPGEVRCHNVNLNGGFWWVVGPDGRRLA